MSLSRDDVNRMFLRVCDGHESIRDAWTSGVDVRRGREELIRTNIPIAAMMADAFHRKGNFSCEYDDIFQAACMGLIEAVDLYKPLDSLGGSFGAYARFRIYKHMVMEWEASHWRTMKPSRAEHRMWFSGKISGDEADRYFEKYLLGITAEDVDDYEQ